MNKQIVLALALTLTLFMAHAWIMTKYYPSQTQELVSNSTETVNITQPIVAPIVVVDNVQVPENKEDLSQKDIGSFSVTYCKTGGYIKRLVFKQYPDHPLPFENIGFIEKQAKMVFSDSSTENSLVFEAQGLRKEYQFDGYMVSLSLSSASEMLILSNTLSRNGLDQAYQENFTSKDTLVTRKPLSKPHSELIENADFAGSRDTFFCATLLKGKYNLKWAGLKNNPANLFMVSPVSKVELYVGPQSEKILQPLGLQGIINYGFFHFIALLIGKLMNLFFAVTKNWGISVILLAIVLFFLMFPFTAQSTKMMKKMQEIQPIVEELKTKYADNPQKMNLEVIALYKEYQINPIGGCLPMLLQLPVFIALYQVFMRMLEFKGASFLWMKDLSIPDHLFSLPFPAPINYLNLLPLIIAALAIIQQKTTLPAKAGPEQKLMGMFFAVLMAVIFYGFPSGLVLYWLVQNLLTFWFQLRVNKTKLV